jgi:hypothetical protein
MLRNYIKEGDINNSLKELCTILNDNKEIDKLEDDFVFIIDYIGKHMNAIHASKFYDIIETTYNFITNETILIDATLVLCCKMCSICKQLYDTPSIHIKTLRKLIITDLQHTLHNQYVRSLENILPTTTSASFPVACNISMCIINYQTTAEKIPIESKELSELTNRLRLCIEYITRKNVYIETSLSKNGDCIWFLWTLILHLSQNPIIQKLYNIFTFKWTAKCKNKRIGILWSSIFFIKFNKNEWTEKENQTFQQIKNMSSQLMEQSKSNHNNILHDFIPTYKS